MPRASLRTIRRERRKSRSEQRFRRTSVSRKFLLAGDTNTLRVSLRAADIESRPDNFGRSYPRFGGARQEGPSEPGVSPNPGEKPALGAASRVANVSCERAFISRSISPGRFAHVTFPLTGERARILSATNAVPLPAAQTGLWLPTADLGMLRSLRCAGIADSGNCRQWELPTGGCDRGWLFGAEGWGERSFGSSTRTRRPTARLTPPG